MVLISAAVSLVLTRLKLLNYIYCRVSSLLKAEEKKLLEGVEVLANPKGVDPLVLSWKGGSVISRLDITKEQWIRQGEWQKKSVRVLREKCSFIW